MANIILARRDSYLDQGRSGINQDTLAALRTASLQLATQFLDNVLKKARYGKSKKGGARYPVIPPDRLRVSHLVNENYCVKVSVS